MERNKKHAVHRNSPRLPPEGDTPAEATSVQFVPSEQWIDAFEAGYSPTLMETTLAYAVARARWVGFAGHPVDDYYPREVVQNAVSDTLIGTLVWVPEDKSLEQHLRDAIRSRTDHDRKHAERFRRHAFHPGAEDSEPGVIAEVEDSLRAADVEASEAPPTHASEMAAEFRRRAGDDQELHRLLDAFAAGMTSKSDVMQFTRFSEQQYAKTRRRLRRLVAHLSTVKNPGRG
jgi:hypothetical protein